MKLCREKHENDFLKKYRFQCLGNTTVSVFLYLTCLTITMIFCIHFLLYDGNMMKNTSNMHGARSRSHNVSLQFDQTNTTFVQTNKERERCDIFQGQWIPNPTGPLYTNYSCTTIPFLRNCFLHGRNDTDFLHWRWKPDKCELPRFRPDDFLTTLRGKTMAFIGDSLARNQMESLLCLLSTIETPKATEKHAAQKATETDVQERFTSTTWEFPKYEFKLMALWSQFLVSATERVINGTATGGFDLQLDKVDTSWSEKLPSIDYAVFSDAHWFFRPNYLYEDGNLIGCVYCNEPNMTDVGPSLAIRRAFRAALKAINDCKNCKEIFTLLRTYSPPHFENGAWNTGGVCNRTWPIGREEVNKVQPESDYRKIQVDEMEMARNAGEGNGNEFEVIDVTEIMSMRPDGHPGLYWGNRWMKGYSDCIHWCMPGPIDTWNELLFEQIKRRITSSETKAGS